MDEDDDDMVGWEGERAAGACRGVVSIILRDEFRS